MDRQALTLSEAESKFPHTLDQLKAPILALGPKEEPRAKEVFGAVEALFKAMIRRVSVSDVEGQEKHLDALRDLLTELERLLSGQQMLFSAMTTGSRVLARALNAQVDHVFKELFEILDAVEATIQSYMGMQAPAKEKPKPRVKATKTYAKAQDDILNDLKRKGWAVVPHLKIPHATSPQGDVRLWFKAQAIYFSFGRALTNMGSAHSLFSGDYRNKPTEEMVKELESDVERVSKRYQRTGG